MSPSLEYETRFSGSVTDKCTCYIASLDFDFLERVSAWIKEHYPDGQISGTFSRETIRAVEYVSNGRYRLSISCAQNKAGIAAKAALLNAFFDESGRRFDMDAEAEKQKILRDIEQGKAAAHKDAAATDKETNTMPVSYTHLDVYKRQGESIDLAASTVPYFKPGKILRDVVKSINHPI